MRQLNGCVGAAAVVAAVAVGLGRELAKDMTVIGEVDADGNVVGSFGTECGEDSETVVRLAQMNAVRVVMVPGSSKCGRQVRKCDPLATVMQ